MPTATEGRYAAEFIVSEAPGTRSREVGVLAMGENLEAGAVLGKITRAGATVAAVAGNTGNGTIAAPTVGAAKVGVYRAICIEPAVNAGAFSIEDPDGVQVGVATVGVAFAGGGLAFTIADGATDFVAGDSFTITIAAGSGEYVRWNPANTNGSQTAVALLYDNVDATDAATEGVIIARDAEVNDAEIVYFTGATAGNKTTAKAQLALVGIIAREGI